MKLEATYMVRLDASEAAFAARTAFTSAMLDDARFGAHELGRLKAVDADIERSFPAAKAALINAAKKQGLTPCGAPDIQYGVHGGRDGAIEYWYQMRAIA